MTDPHVRSALAAQHARIAALFELVKGADGDTRRRRLADLTRYLALHEAAEQVALHGASVREALPSTELARKRMAEEENAAHILARLEELDPGSTQFDVQLGLLEEGVSFHAREEEEKELPAFLAAADAAGHGRLMALLDRVEAAYADRVAMPDAGTFRQQLAAAHEAFMRF